MKPKITPYGIADEKKYEEATGAFFDLDGSRYEFPIGIDVKNLRRNVTNFLVDNCTIQYEREELMEELQVLNEEHGDGTRWPTTRNNLNGILLKNNDNDYTRRAWYLYDMIGYLSGKEAAVSDLGKRMNNRRDWYRIKDYAEHKYRKEKAKHDQT